MSHPGMCCREFVEFLSAYIDGDLPDDVRKDFEKHWIDCPPCLDYLESFRATIRMTHELGRCEETLPAAEVPRKLIDAILEARRRCKDGPR
ncbi:MAG: zf-HC2 domain-containing protein [Planctomycetes bacterium]|nr:zf-HC2 domain-containing protein [Planctomycetota bacterium]